MAMQYFKGNISQEEVYSRFEAEGYAENGYRIEETEKYYYFLSEYEYLVGDNICIDNAKLINVWKSFKSKAASDEAKKYLESGEALYEFVHNGNTYHIEATDGNIAKIGLKVTALLMANDLETIFPWNTKEDINIEINALEGKAIAEGMEAVQTEIWTVKYPAYLEVINNLDDLDTLIKFKFDYANFTPAEEEVSEAVEQGDEESPSDITESEE